MTQTQSTTVARYGEWPSPISAELVAGASGSPSWPSVVTGEVWWCATDPTTATVRLLRCRPGQTPSDVLEPGWSVRNRSLGYGGRPYLATATGDAHQLVFTDHRDQRVYRAEVPVLDDPSPVNTPMPLTPVDSAGVTSHFADLVLGPTADEVWCVREVTRLVARTGDQKPVEHTSRQIVAIPLDGSATENPDAVRIVATSHHFLSGIRVSPDGRRLAWIGWDHPRMPWDETELMVADLVDGVAAGATCVLGGKDVSVPQVEWAGPDALYAMADPDGWWNLHRVDLQGGSVQVRCVLRMQRECAGALWRVGPTWFAVTTAGVVLRHGTGAQRLALWDPASGALRDLAPEWTEFGADISGCVPGDAGPAAVVTAGSVDRDNTVLYVPLPRTSEQRIDDPIPCVTASQEHLRPWNPTAQRRVASGVNGREVHYVYYPPTNPDYVGPSGAAPPLLVHAHGGPTSRANAIADIEFGLFCSRGFAVASVDYGGSTGYGREYRNRLRSNWGIVDVEDCVAVARDLAAQGLADPARTAIRGGSAGGWTALACLGSTDVFCAGAVYYPISDPLSWSGEATHDFESQYVRSLVGELPADLEHYLRVSPLAKADRIRSPLVMLQGADDVICKPDQAQRIVDAAAARDLWQRYVVFDGEGHGFRKESSIAASLRTEAELYSYAMGIAVDLSSNDLYAKGSISRDHRL